MNGATITSKLVATEPEKIRLLVLDIDGVLTNAQVLVTEQGEQLRAMSIKDGYAIRHAIDQGLDIAVISGGKSEGARLRLQGLGVQHIFLGIRDKLPVFQDLLRSLDIIAAETAYLGDDIPDLPALSIAGFGACPADAEEELFGRVDYVCQRKGGEGCVREVIKLILSAKGQWSVHF